MTDDHEPKPKVLDEGAYKDLATTSERAAAVMLTLVRAATAREDQ